MDRKIKRFVLPTLAAAFLTFSFNVAPASAAIYYSEQENFSENVAPAANYSWDQKGIDSCIYKDEGVPNSYYAWTKLAVQKWRQALREYTDNTQAWTISARHVKSLQDLQSCNVKIYVHDSYKDFPDSQTGAFTSVRQDGETLDSRVYLSPFILHGDGNTELNLPPHAFRNSAVHEIGHVLGLGHMKSEKGYLMSPQFDFFEEEQEYPITTLELKTLVRLYGEDGFQQ